MNIATHRQGSPPPADTATGSATCAKATSVKIMVPQGSASKKAATAKELRQTWARRRWAGVAVIAVTLLLTLLMQIISIRTALMVAGAMLTFALSADRLDEIDD